MKKGKVKFFNVTKGFGFIIYESGDNLYQIDEVEFSLKQGNKGMNAVDVKISG